MTPVTGGASGALTFRVERGGRRYLLRMEGQASPLRNPHQYLSMHIAAEAGIALVVGLSQLRKNPRDVAHAPVLAEQTVFHRKYIA